MADKFSKFPSTIDGPAKSAFAVVPTNNTELTNSTKGIYVGGAGDLNVIFVGDTANTALIGVQAGSILPFRIKTVHATGTTATNIVGLL